MAKLLTAQELASQLKIPVSWIYSRTRIKTKDSIPCVRIGKYVRFNEEEIMEWIKSQQQKG